MSDVLKIVIPLLINGAGYTLVHFKKTQVIYTSEKYSLD